MKSMKLLLRMAALVKPLMHIMVLAIFLGVLGFLCADFLGVLAVSAMLRVINGESFSNLLLLLIFFGIIRGFLRYGEQASNHYIAFKLLALIRDRVFSVMRQLAPARLEGKDRGNLISIITSDIELLEVFYAHTISPVLIALIMSLIMFVFFAYFSWMIAVYALLAYLFVGILIPMFVHRKVNGQGEQVRKLSGEMSSYVLETLRGQKEIIQYHAFEERIEEMRRKGEKLALCEKKMKEVQGINASISAVAILVFSIGMIIVSSQIIEPANVLIVSLAMISSFPPVLALASLSSTIQPTLAAAQRVLALLDEKPLLEEVKEGEHIDTIQLKLDQVSFGYDSHKVLDHFSLESVKHEVVGIAGKSGCGKSTLLKLIMRFWDIQEGTLYIDNKSIEKIETADLRKHQSYMTQSTHLFCESILNNIQVAKEDATLEEVISASKKASLHDFVMSLPRGYDTLVSECGDSLSGGEKQRIGLARAFLHDADMMLLDEATSNLDSLNEKIILKSLKEQALSKTIFLVSHRLSTLGWCDRILKMEEGKIVE